MNREKFYTILSSYDDDKSDLVRLVFEESGVSAPSISTDDEAEPKDLTLDTVVYVSQELKSGEVKKFEFVICEVWLKPQNMWTIVNIKKEKEEKNFWILFYDNGTYYLKKGIKGPIGVHVHLKHPNTNN